MPLSFGRRLGPSGRAHYGAAISSLLVLVFLALALGACTDQTDQRAVQPGQVLFGPTPTGDSFIRGAATPGFASPVTSPTSVTSVLPADVGDVGEPAPTRVYFTHGGDIWQVPFGPGEAVPVVTGKSILAFAPSPDGEQVAFVYLAADTGQEHLADFNADGTSVVDVGLQIPADDQASHGGDIQSIAWAPSGDEVAIARQDGSIAVVDTAGKINQIVGPNPDRFPGSLSVSPDGRTLLFLDPDLPGRYTSLYVVPMSGGETRKLVDGTETSRPVLEARWLPRRNLIAYAQPVVSSPEGSGDVYTIDATTTASQLVVPSSMFAPVAGIGTFAFSTEGKWVAFTLYVPHDNGIRFQGLWLMNLTTGVKHQVATESGQTVTDLWWGKDSLIYRSVKADETTKPEHYTGLEPYWLYAISPDSGQPVLRQKSS